MDTQEIIRQLEAERDCLNAAIAVLKSQSKGRVGRRKGARRKMSAEGRAAIAKAQKARWKKFKARKKS